MTTPSSIDPRLVELFALINGHFGTELTSSLAISLSNSVRGVLYDAVVVGLR
jgi:hypothetical protein